ncbi:Cell division protein FtsH [Rhodovulum sp. P5]|nr:Cell division protein FtsH [Rhodovulum sp. P5]
MRLGLREATLGATALIVTDADRIDLATLIGTLEAAQIPIALTADRRLALNWPTFAIPALGHDRAQTLWRYGLGPGDEVTADRMAHQFRLSAADILRVAADTRCQGADAVAKACLAHSTTLLDRFATAIDCRHDWDDLVLPPRQMRLLRSIVQRARHARTVYDQWGFGEKLAPNRGVTALFSGPSGAGKTLSAGVVARDLGLPLYRVDLSATVSKYIGETEKQLEQIFSAAEAGNACLFFDECDALFGKRSEVSDAHDRYANIETSYLLQRLEIHRGIVFLASNYPQNIDEAFTRRIDLTVEFPMPDAGLRSALWQRLLPPAAGAEIDADRLGRQFELSGGSIRNCLVTAAFLAAEDGAERIETRHCLMAVAQEYEKTGRPLTRADFGEAFLQLRPARNGG